MKGTALLTCERTAWIHNQWTVRLLCKKHSCNVKETIIDVSKGCAVTLKEKRHLEWLRVIKQMKNVMNCIIPGLKLPKRTLIKCCRLTCWAAAALASGGKRWLRLWLFSKPAPRGFSLHLAQSFAISSDPAFAWWVETAGRRRHGTCR